MSIIPKELLKNVLNRFIANGHSSETSYLIVRYFIGLRTDNLNDYQKKVEKTVTSHTYTLKPNVSVSNC